MLSKISERAIEVQLNEYTELIAILPITQSGFHRCYGCATVLHVDDDIIRSQDIEKRTILVMPGFSRAFDTLSHKLSLFSYMGFSVNATIPMSAYLSNRRQEVEIDETRSQAAVFNVIFMIMIPNSIILVTQV